MRVATGQRGERGEADRGLFVAPELQLNAIKLSPGESCIGNVFYRQVSFVEDKSPFYRQDANSRSRRTSTIWIFKSLERLAKSSEEERIIVGSRETTCRKIAPRSHEGREAKLYKGRNVSSNNVNKKETQSCNQVATR